MGAKKLGERIRLARVGADLTQVETLVKLAKVLKKPTTYFLDELA